jgi:Gas vesicle protein
MAALLLRRRCDEHVTEVLPADNNRRIALVDLLDRVLGGGVVITGDITLSIADVDLVIVSLRTLISSVGSLLPDDDDGGGYA